jgi:hypothetical protein
VLRLCAFLLIALMTGCQAAVPAAPPKTAPPPTSAPAAPTQTPALAARIVAVGIPGANAISPVGTFHAGGPIHDKPNFAASTEAGKVLDPARIVVTSSSNFGAPRGREDQPEGTVLSLDPRGTDTIVVPAGFAAGGGQASGLNGRVQVFTAQNAAFVNKLTKPNAVTADQPAVSNPQGISINNAFGRLWFANSPAGMTGMGTETIIDPDGRPLADAPDELAGGVFAGSLTNRADQKIAGSLATGATGNALLGRSPDGSTKAVFAVVTADGAVLQAHAQQGIDGLAPVGTVRPLTAAAPTRAGMAFNWTPDRMLYVTEPAGNSIAVLNLSDDGAVFRMDSARHLTAPELSVPVDLAAAVPEVANPEFSSNTTLAGGSDLYVANRGNGTIVRMRQDGHVVATRQVQLASGGVLGADRLEGIAVSPDASRLWLTVNGALPGFAEAPGSVIEVPAFGAAGAP